MNAIAFGRDRAGFPDGARLRRHKKGGCNDGDCHYGEVQGAVADGNRIDQMGDGFRDDHERRNRHQASLKYAREGLRCAVAKPVL